MRVGQYIDGKGSTAGGESTTGGDSFLCALSPVRAGERKDYGHLKQKYFPY